MRIRFLATTLTLAMTALGACGGDTSTAPPPAFEPQGKWLYLGPWDSLHRVQITNSSMTYTDIAGEWSSDWSIKDYDNGLKHFEIVFKSGNGTYLPVGQNFSGTYILSDAILVVQLTSGLGSYSPIDDPSCTKGDTELIPDCGRYMKEN